MSDTHADSLDILVQGLFDYAGMFPPENKPFDDALRAAARFNADLKRPHMVGSQFVIRLEHLGQITSARLLECGFNRSSSFFVSLLGTPLDKKQAVVSEERFSELSAIQDFNARGLQEPIRQKIVSYECQLAPEIQQDLETLPTALRNMKSFLQDETLIVCFEANLSGENWEETLALLVGSIGDVNVHCKGPPLALKIRGSGPQGLSIEKLARVIQLSTQADLDIKATAGFHHPIIERELYGNTHGFLNLAVAVYFARILGIERFDRSNIEACLACDNARDFRFGDELRWRDFSVTKEDLLNAKETFFLSVGSCSLKEPDDDLARLYPL